MSWSVNATGKPAAVKAALVEQFANAQKNTAAIPEESRTVELVEQLVNTQLDYMMEIPKQAVSVSAGGSAYKPSTYPQGGGSLTVTYLVQPVYNWVE